ncbi:hypothetical protein KCP73_13840 [Salmonella enterica subsp. enterica]|nr:hypothetical protein KCP73_13840 [Salmonella enterica subsp. enterica]
MAPLGIYFSHYDDLRARHVNRRVAMGSNSDLLIRKELKTIGISTSAC